MTNSNDQFRYEPVYQRASMRLMLSLFFAAALTALPLQAQQTAPRPTPSGNPAASPAAPFPAPAAMPRQGEKRPLFAEQPMLDEEVAVLIQAGEETTLSSQMGGRILKVNVGLGDSVAAGAALLEFDCSEQLAQVQAAQAEYRGTRETHLTKLKLQALGAAGELEVTVAAAATDKAKSQVDLRESQMAYCKVSAPFSGRVARLRVKASESVNINQPLIEVVNPASLKAQMFVPSSYVRSLKPGSPFQVKFDDGRVFRARVAKMNSRVEGVSQQLEIEGSFDGQTAGLLPGMVGTAIFPGRPSGR